MGFLITDKLDAPATASTSNRSGICSIM